MEHVGEWQHVVTYVQVRAPATDATAQVLRLLGQDVLRRVDREGVLMTGRAPAPPVVDEHRRALSVSGPFRWGDAALLFMLFADPSTPRQRTALGEQVLRHLEAFGLGGRRLPGGPARRRALLAGSDVAARAPGARSRCATARSTVTTRRCASRGRTSSWPWPSPRWGRGAMTVDVTGHEWVSDDEYLSTLSADEERPDALFRYTPNWGQPRVPGSARAMSPVGREGVSRPRRGRTWSWRSPRRSWDGAVSCRRSRDPSWKTTATSSGGRTAGLLVPSLAR